MVCLWQATVNKETIKLFICLLSIMCQHTPVHVLHMGVLLCLNGAYRSALTNTQKKKMKKNIPQNMVRKLTEGL